MVRGLILLVTALPLLLPPGWCLCRLFEEPEETLCHAGTDGAVTADSDDCHCNEAPADRMPAQRGALNNSITAVEWLAGLQVAPTFVTSTPMVLCVRGWPPGNLPR